MDDDDDDSNYEPNEDESESEVDEDGDDDEFARAPVYKLPGPDELYVKGHEKDVVDGWMDGWREQHVVVVNDLKKLQDIVNGEAVLRGKGIRGVLDDVVNNRVSTGRWINLEFMQWLLRSTNTKYLCQSIGILTSIVGVFILCSAGIFVSNHFKLAVQLRVDMINESFMKVKGNLANNEKVANELRELLNDLQMSANNFTAIAPPGLSDESVARMFFELASLTHGLEIEAKQHAASRILSVMISETAVLSEKLPKDAALKIVLEGTRRWVEGILQSKDPEVVHQSVEGLLGFIGIIVWDPSARDITPQERIVLAQAYLSISKNAARFLSKVGENKAVMEGLVELLESSTGHSVEVLTEAEETWKSTFVQYPLKYGNSVGEFLRNTIAEQTGSGLIGQHFLDFVFKDFISVTRALDQYVRSPEFERLSKDLGASGALAASVNPMKSVFSAAFVAFLGVFMTFNHYYLKHVYWFLHKWNKKQENFHFMQGNAIINSLRRMRNTNLIDQSAAGTDAAWLRQAYAEVRHNDFMESYRVGKANFWKILYHHGALVGVMVALLGMGLNYQRWGWSWAAVKIITKIVFNFSGGAVTVVLANTKFVWPLLAWVMWKCMFIRVAVSHLWGLKRVAESTLLFSTVKTRSQNTSSSLLTCTKNRIFLCAESYWDWVMWLSQFAITSVNHFFPGTILFCIA